MHKISKEQLDKFMDICNKKYPEMKISREEALGYALRLLNIIDIILQNNKLKD